MTGKHEAYMVFCCFLPLGICLMACLHFRCNNVLYMRGVPETDEDGEARTMEEA